MKSTKLLTLAIAMLAAPAFAQTNPAPATPANHLSMFWSPNFDIEGRIGVRRSSLYVRHQGTTTAVSTETTACNPGTVNGEWFGTPSENHPVIAQMYCRQLNGRFEQISDWGYVKHSFASTNTTECGLPGNCVNGGFNILSPGCSDTYTSGRNAGRTRLGPPGEINPWIGQWRMFGSHLDVGFPRTTPDGNVSNISTGGSDILFRNKIADSDLNVPGATYYCQGHYIHKWELEQNRENNLTHRTMNLSTSSGSTTGTRQAGTVLQRYTGARLESNVNVNNGMTQDGRIYVACLVTPNGDGTWHYEYVVHNRDSQGRNAGFVVPKCANASVTGIGFKDIDNDPVSDWTASVTGTEIRWDPPVNTTAGATIADSYAQGWNTLFNFWFDCDAAPGDGSTTIWHDPMLMNPGAAPTMTVDSDCPLVMPNLNVAAGCGLDISINGQATFPNAGLGMSIANGNPGAGAAFHIAFSANILPLGPPIGPIGCNLLTPDFALTTVLDGAGAGAQSLALPNNPSLEGSNLWVQGAALLIGGPVVNSAELSDVMQIRVGNSISGCN